MRSEPLVSYPLVRITDVHEASLAVAIADARETGLIHDSIQRLPSAIREAAIANADAIEAGFGDVVGSLGSIEDSLAEQTWYLSNISEALSEGFERLGALGSAQLKQLEAIRHMIERPLDTGARELRDRGMRGYSFGLYDEALADLESSVNNNIYDHIAHLHIGHIQLLRRSPEAAVKAYEMAVRYSLAPPEGHPERAEFHGSMAYLGLARSFAVMREHNQAYQAAGRAVDLAPERADVHYEMARCALLKGDYTTAEKEWSRCLALDPLPFLAVAIAETQAVFPAVPVQRLREAAADVQRQLIQVSGKLHAVAHTLGFGPKPGGSQLTMTETGAAESILRNRVMLDLLAETTLSYRTFAESRRNGVHGEAVRIASSESRQAVTDQKKAAERVGCLSMMLVYLISAGIIYWQLIEHPFLVPPEDPSSGVELAAVMGAVMFGWVPGLVVGWIVSIPFQKLAKGHELRRRPISASEPLLAEVALLDRILVGELTAVGDELNHLQSKTTVGPSDRSRAVNGG